MAHPRSRRASLGPRLYYGWWIVLAGLAIRATAIGSFVWAFGVLIRPLEAEFGWNRAEISAAVSLSLLVAGLGGPLAGRLVDRWSARGLIMAGAAIYGFSLALLSAISSLWQLYLGYTVMAMGRVALAYIPLNTLVARWFGRRRGRALGLSAAGMGIGGFLFVPFTSWLVERLGWRGTYLVLAVLLLGIVLSLAVWVIRDRPPPSAQNERPEARAPPPVPVATAEIVRSRPFWVLCGVFALVWFSQFSVAVHSVPFLIQRGLGPGDAASVVGLTAGLGVATPLLVGLLAERWLAPTAVLMLTLSVQAAVLAGALVLPLPGTVLLWIVGVGITNGAAETLEALIVSRAFGLARFGTIQGLMGIVETATFMLGPVFAGYLYDLRGDYVASFTAFAGTNLLAVLAMGLARRRGLVGGAATYGR